MPSRSAHPGTGLKSHRAPSDAPGVVTGGKGWVAGALAALALGAGGVALWQHATHDGADSQTVVAAGRPATEPIAARPAPATPPRPVAATGGCGAAMASIRTLQRQYPSGSLLPEAANRQLTTDLATLHEACAATPAVERAFRRRELTPWLTYLPPGATPAG
jgi:hypothetical protein